MANDESKSLEVRTTEITDNPDLMDNIFLNVASGGSLIELCATWQVRYADLMLWINHKSDRQRVYSEALVARGEWFKETVLLELRRIGSADIRRLYDKEGELLPVHKWPTDVARFVASIEVNELWEGVGKDREQVGIVKKVKLWNKEKALELIGKNVQMFTEVHVHKLGGTLEDLIQASREPDDKG